MPTATSLSGFSLTNIGPLTTTFSAPQSCSTIEIVLAAATDPTDVEWDAECQFVPPADCNPSGSVLQSIVTAAQGTNPTAGFIFVYHSPGLVCPAGWATVGGAAKLSPTSTSISGVFNQSSAIPTGNQFPFFEPGLDVFLDALDPGETAFLCCPSSYTNNGGDCYSTLPSSAFTPTAGCRRVIPKVDVGSVFGTWTIGGETVTGALETLTGTAPITTETTSFAPAEATSYVGVAISAIFLLVHQASDTAAATESSASASPSKTSAAGPARGRENRLGVAGVCCLALAVSSLFVL